ncbi:class I SAM-dependent methyltransferase [Chlorobium sp. BLA1]|uniref:class I SAM-dependent methyltransferase n=1 Tax=Candidatus Chlorobium masyuteum TaxID=2716876 RepID=UPI001420919B|nr:class I SAM-dependent methyltransferase [Candidatus Chlorobium masyuteum]NHQ59180.1 class I SAM-dependent methyltransferase [Candidatus Chlorobium masyuteum]
MHYTLNAEDAKIKCPVCNCGSYFWVRLNNVLLNKCDECNHVFTDIVSIAKEETYGSEYYLNTHRNWFKNPNYKLFSIIAENIKSCNAKSLLDVGCGDGALLNYLGRILGDIELNGIDLSAVVPREAGFTFLQGDFMTFDFKRKFDVIVSLAVIEHINDVSSYVQRVHGLLNSDGTAYLMTVNSSGILYRLSYLLRRLGVDSVFNRLYDPHHLNHFSKQSLSRLLTKEGLFRVEKIINHNAPLAAIDCPASNNLIERMMRLGVGIVFFIGKITQKTYLQTIIVSKIS